MKEATQNGVALHKLPHCTCGKRSGTMAMVTAKRVFKIPLNDFYNREIDASFLYNKKKLQWRPFERRAGPAWSRWQLKSRVLRSGSGGRQ